jgi:alpha-tubulin suppressor-like RCC1 family protein
VLVGCGSSSQTSSSDGAPAGRRGSAAGSAGVDTAGAPSSGGHAALAGEGGSGAASGTSGGGGTSGAAGSTGGGGGTILGAAGAGMGTGGTGGGSAGAFATLAASYWQACVIAEDARLWCWGTRSQALVCGSQCITEPPHPVAGLSDVVEVALGTVHGCALEGSGSMLCWGGNDIGQVGPFDHGDDLAAQLVELGAPVFHIGAGSEFSCAVLGDGSTTCWGATPTFYQRSGGDLAPELVADLDPAATVSGGGEHACAMLHSGEVECWGDPRWGKVGTGTPTSTAFFAPTRVAGVSGVTFLDSTANRNCVLMGASDPVCWGKDVAGPWLGDEQPDALPYPVGQKLTRLTLGLQHACGLEESGRVLCWGLNTSGQLGAGDMDPHDGPVEVQGLSDVAQIAAGSDFTCALTTSDEVWCWGQNDWGQLGVNSPIASAVPLRVALTQ